MGDLRFNGSGWNYHDFRGDRWRNIQNGDNRNCLRNASSSPTPAKAVPGLQLANLHF